MGNPSKIHPKWWGYVGLGSLIMPNLVWKGVEYGFGDLLTHQLWSSGENPKLDILGQVKSVFCFRPYSHYSNPSSYRVQHQINIAIDIQDATAPVPAQPPQWVDMRRECGSGRRSCPPRPWCHPPPRSGNSPGNSNLHGRVCSVGCCWMAVGYN